MKGHLIAVPATKYSPAKFGKVLRVYYSKNGVMYDISWDGGMKSSIGQNYIDWQIKVDNWTILNNEKDLLKHKLKMKV